MKMYRLFFVLFACTVFSQLKSQDKSNDTTARYFLIQASIGNLQEIATGKLAMEKATSPAIKGFAKRMITDHTNAQIQLLQLAKTRSIQLPHEATDAPVEDLMLKKMEGKDFDRAYVHMMVPDHRETVALFAKYALTGKDPGVKTFAEQTLPVLKEHLAAITAIDNNMEDPVVK